MLKLINMAKVRKFEVASENHIVAENYIHAEIIHRNS